jgi:hypothetical protein
MRDHARLAPGEALSASRRAWPIDGRVGSGPAVATARPGFFWWLPAACAAIYFGAFLVSFHDIIASVYINSDAAVAPVLGQAIGHIPAGAYASLGNHAWYEEWLFLLATRGWSAHLRLWELAPALWSLFGLGIFVWTARGALGAWSAALAGAALVCVGAFGRFCFLAIEWHSLSLVHTILLVAASVWLVPRLGSMSWRRVVAVAAGLGILSALPTASDSLFLPWALIPFVVMAAAMVPRLSPAARARLVVFSAIVVCLAAVGAQALASIMRHHGIASRSLPVALVSLNMIGHNLELLGESYAYLAGGRIVGPSLQLQNLLVLASAILVLVGILLVLDQARRIARSRAIRDAMTDRELAYVTFWTTSLVATSLVFVFTDAPRDAQSGRYLLAGYAATAALLPVVASRSPRARSLITAGVCVFALIAAYQLIRRPFVVIRPDASVTIPTSSTATALASFARQEGVSYGYAGYWDAEALTWATDFKVLVRPVRVCSSRSLALCYPQLGMVSSWYSPKPRTRTLLVVDAAGPSLANRPRGRLRARSHTVLLAPDPALGKPLVARRLGQIEVYVYPYDIASRLASPDCNFAWAHPC